MNPLMLHPSHHPSHPPYTAKLPRISQAASAQKAAGRNPRNFPRRAATPGFDWFYVSFQSEIGLTS